MTLEKAIKIERMLDELRSIQLTNIARLPGETYEENLKRRATLTMRENELAAAICALKDKT